MEKIDFSSIKGLNPVKRKKRMRWIIGSIHFMVFSIMLSSFIYQYMDGKERTMKIALASAESSFERDYLFRLWGSMHGGVYVPITEKTPPNPYLTQVDEKNIETPKGKKLTLMNPAYMTRQIYELGSNEKEFVYENHITSLNPIRPENSADEWETNALKEFESGLEKAYSVETTEEGEYFRFMRPLVVEESCMKCHSQQGYSVGDIRGGISVSFPFEPYQLMISRSFKTLIIWHLTVLVVINFLLYFGQLRIQKAFEDRERSLGSLLIKEKELNKALVKAEEGDRLKSAFLANMSHEIRTPLNAIMGFSELLENREIQEKEKGTYLKLIQDNGDNLLNIINDILDISMIESGQFSIIKSDFDINHLLSSIYVEYSKHLEIKNNSQYQLELDIPSTATLICSDRKRIRQIISNLIENAIKYAGKGTIRFGFSWKNDSHIEIFVQDTGKGIPPEQLSNIFKVFRRLEKGPSDPVRGAGLGLTLVKNLTETLGGEVSVESKAGQGTIFTIIIPVKAKVS